MKPTQTLPETYQLEGTMGLSKDKRLAIILNLLGVVVFLLSGGIFVRVALMLRGGNELVSLLTTYYSPCSCVLLVMQQKPQLQPALSLLGVRSYWHCRF